ncbi:UNVERIFIED_CONTAM: Nuclear receptor sub 2 group C member 2 [Siphonaria sp. JEL0065]|nr:Nuclear receptor sub 2 group C member 2 [Siphonaria sp. JEL0065]
MDQVHRIPRTRLTIDKDNVLGKGGFGIVYSGVWQGSQVALKFIVGDQAAKEKAALANEITALSRLRHPFIVTLWGICEDSVDGIPAQIMVMDRMETSLFNRLYSDNVPPLIERAKWIRQTATAFLYLHGQEPPIVHTDLKPDNILIDVKGNACVTDFGLSRITHLTRSARQYSKNNGFEPRQGSFLFAPPESFSPVYRPATPYDVYSFGMTMYQILSDLFPFSETYDPTYEKVKDWVKNDGYRPERPNGFDGSAIPDFCWSLVESCWVQDPKERPKFDDIVGVIEGWSFNMSEVVVSSAQDISLTDVERYSKAALQGDTVAQNNLGDCYYNGNGVRQDYALAVEWYRKAADQGNTHAQKQLATPLLSSYVNRRN